MKPFLISVFIAASSSICMGASTDTITSAATKVVEIHMTSARIRANEETNTKRRKSSTMPLPGHATCSGEFISGNGDILTAGHCVEGFDEFEVITADQRKYTATVVSTSAVHDLAIIHIDLANTPYFLLADKAIRGEPISILGSPLAITDVLSEGVVARIDGDVTLLDCAALPGNSGGPVFNGQGELLGVLTAGYIVMLGTTHLTVAQGVDAVRFFIKKAIK